MRSKLSILFAVLATSSAAHATLTVGVRAPDLSGRTHEGKPFRLHSMRGMVVVVDFWGPG